jgi:hypothetical protein
MESRAIKCRSEDAGGNEVGHGSSTTSTSDLLSELARRFRLRYGRLEVIYHDGRPSPRVTVEHRIQRDLDET